jgi:hypothetical protein
MVSKKAAKAAAPTSAMPFQVINPAAAPILNFGPENYPATIIIFIHYPTPLACFFYHHIFWGFLRLLATSPGSNILIV